MGRPRSFDTALVVTSARQAFITNGYNGTSIDDLLRATGIQRASLYQAFGSKRGLFMTALRDELGKKSSNDLLLVALMDLSATDGEVRSIVQKQVDTLGSRAAEKIGVRLLRRGKTTLNELSAEDN